MERRVLQDPELQARFDEYGYVLVPFLSEEEIKYLRDEYHKLDSDLGMGFHATMHSHKVDYRRKVNKIISSIFTPRANEFLDDFRQLVSNYTVKEPGPDSFFDLHLDWTMIDETKYRSITIWCPLEDVNAENGHLWVLDKSHLWGHTIRGGPGLFLYTSPEVSLDNRFEKRNLSLKAGQAIIYDHRLFHGSPPNMTAKTRLAINQAMMPTELPSWHYQQGEENKIDIYEVDDDFYNRYVIGSKPTDAKIIKTLEITDGQFVDQQVVNSLVKEKVNS